MAWNPDSGLSLTSGAISVTDVEHTSMSIWNEFLAGWFDGSGHVLVGSYMPFPKIDALAFQSMALPPKLEGLYLTVVTSRSGSALRRTWSGNRLMITERTRVDFYFRSTVKTARADGHNAESLVRYGADRLFSVLSSVIAVKPLTYLGIGNIRAQPPVVAVAGVVPMRHLSCSAVYTYPSEETALTVVVGNASPNTYRFKDGYFQIWNPDTQKFHNAIAEGSPPQLALSIPGEPTDAPAGTPAPYRTYRFKDSKGLQLYSADTGLWHTVLTSGTIPDFGVSDGESVDAANPPASSRVYRFRNGVLQLWNPDTARWHTVSSVGSLPQFGISQEGES